MSCISPLTFLREEISPGKVSSVKSPLRSSFTTCPIKMRYVPNRSEIRYSHTGNNIRCYPTELNNAGRNHRKNDVIDRQYIDNCLYVIYRYYQVSAQYIEKHYSKRNKLSYYNVCYQMRIVYSGQIIPQFSIFVLDFYHCFFLFIFFSILNRKRPADSLYLHLFLDDIIPFSYLISFLLFIYMARKQAEKLVNLPLYYL